MSVRRLTPAAAAARPSSRLATSTPKQAEKGIPVMKIQVKLCLKRYAFVTCFSACAVLCACQQRAVLITRFLLFSRMPTPTSFQPAASSSFLQQLD